MAGLMSSWFPSAATEIPCSGAMSLFHHLVISDRLDPYERSPKRIASSTPWSAMFLAVSPELLLSPQSPAAPKLKSGSAPDAGDDGVVLLYGGLTDGGLTDGGLTDGGFFDTWTESSIKGGRCAEGIVTTAVIARITKIAAGKPSLSNIVIRGDIRTNNTVFSNYFNFLVLARDHTFP